MLSCRRRLACIIVATVVSCLSLGTVDAAQTGDGAVPVAPGTPVTVTTRVRFTGTPQDKTEIDLAGLFADAQSRAGLTLRWVSESTGWFPLWRLEVVADRTWLPSTRSTQTDGETTVLPLGRYTPETGDVYDVKLAYHPDGEVSVAVHNVTTGAEVVATSFPAKLPRIPLYPGVADKNALAEVELVAVNSDYAREGLPLALEREFSWSLALGAADGSFTPTRDMKFFAGDAIGLRLNWPQTAIPGAVHLQAVQDNKATVLLTASWQPGEVVLPVHSLPAGRSTLQLDYVDGEKTHTLAKTAVEYIASWARIAPADLAQLKPSDFSPAELFMPDTLDITDKHMPYYLAHFHTLANAVREDGFIDISVWRNQSDNAPYNARVMESILSLAFFYVTDRPWNPYYGSPALRARLEAALRFWVNMQNSDGRFSEYGPGRWNLPATAFATKFMGETLRLLQAGPAIDPQLLTAATAALRKAIVVTLTNSSLYSQGKRYSNQFGNIWPGALAYLALHADAEIESMMKKRLVDAERDLQSPAGYYYELDSVDWGYNLGTHRTNVRTAWRYVKSDPRYSDVAASLTRSEERWYEWLSYNAVREPDGSAFFLNRGIESRTRRDTIDRLDTELAEVIPLARAFATTEEESAAKSAALRAEVERTWPSVSSLRVGSAEAYSPYPFLHQPITPWFPTNEQRDAAVATLPYVARTDFNHQRVDSRNPLVLTYVRRPQYYAVFNAGRSQSSQQRFGLGLLWHPAAGTMLQTQSNSAVAAWGTKPAAGLATVYEADMHGVTYQVAGQAWVPQPGNRDLARGDVRISYPLGTQGQKTVTFGEKGLDVQVKHQGAFTEFIPMLKAPDDKLVVEQGRATLSRSGVTLEIAAAGGVSIKAAPTGERAGRYEVIAVRLEATDALTYSLYIVDSEAQ